MQKRRKPALVIGNCHFRVCSAIGIPLCVARSLAYALESEMQLVRRSKFLDYEVPMESLPNFGRLTMTQAQTDHQAGMTDRDATRWSYLSGTSDTPLLGMTIGDAFDRTVARFPDRDALPVRVDDPQG